MKKIYGLLFIAVAVVALTFLGCSKNQRVVRQLDGAWEVTDMKYNGASDPDEDFSSVTYEFEKCRVKKEDCSGKMVVDDPEKGPFDIPFTYSISEKGTKITITVNFFGETDTQEGDIIEHSRKKFIYEYTDEDGNITQTTLEKL